MLRFDSDLLSTNHISGFASRDGKGEAVDAKEVYIILHEMKKCEVYRRIKF